MPKPSAAPFRKLAASLLLPLALTACERAKKTTDAQDVAQAQTALDQGDLRGGAINAHNAAQKNPNNADAHRLLSLINLELGNGEAAEIELKRATDLGIAREVALPILAKALLLQGKYQDVLDRIDLPAQMNPQDGARLMALRGDAWLGVGKPDKARADYEAALMLDATAPTGKLGLARLALGGGDAPQALAWVREAMQREPRNAELWSFQGQLYEAQGDPAQAEASYTQAIDLRQRDVFDRSRRVWVRLSQGKTQAAQEDVTALERQFANHFLTHFTRGLLLFKQRQLPEALTEFEATSKLNEGYAEALYFQGVTQLLMDHLPNAQELLARFNALVPNTVRGSIMMGLVKVKLNDLPEAAKWLLPVLEQYPDNIQALQLMGNIELSRGNSAKALEYLNRAVVAGDRTGQPRATGKADPGLGEMETALATDPALVRTEVQIVLIHLQDKAYAKAIEAVEAMKKRMPGSALPFNLLAEVYVRQGDDAKAEAVLKAGLRQVPDDVGTLQSLARLAIKNRHDDQARQYCQTALGLQPKDLPSRLCLVELNERAGDQSGVAEELQTAIQDHPEALLPQLTLSRLYARMGQPRRGLALLDTARARFGEQPEFVARLVEAQIETGQPGQALETAGQLVKLEPRSARAEYLLALAEGANGHAAEMRAALQRSLHHNPKFRPTREALIRALAGENHLAEAERDLKQLASEYPGDGGVLALKGWLALRQKQWSAATAAYRQALDKDPNNPDIAVELARGQWFGNDREGGLKTLSDWSARHPQDVAVHHVLAGFYGETGRRAEQLAAYEKALAIDPDDTLALNELAWELKAENPARALQYADRAVKLAPDSVPVFDTQVAVLIEQTEFERALGLLLQAKKRWPDNTMVLYRLAVAQDKVGSTAQAIKTLRELLASHPGAFAERKDAEGLLARLAAR